MPDVKIIDEWGPVGDLLFNTVDKEILVDGILWVRGLGGIWTGKKAVTGRDGKITWSQYDNLIYELGTPVKKEEREERVHKIEGQNDLVYKGTIDEYPDFESPTTYLPNLNGVNPEDSLPWSKEEIESMCKFMEENWDSEQSAFDIKI